MKKLLEIYEKKSPEIVFEWRDHLTEAKGWIVINSLRGGGAGVHGWAHKEQRLRRDRRHPDDAGDQEPCELRCDRERQRRIPGQQGMGALRGHPVEEAVAGCFLEPQDIGLVRPSAPATSIKYPLVLRAHSSSPARSASGHTWSSATSRSALDRQPEITRLPCSCTYAISLSMRRSHSAFHLVIIEVSLLMATAIGGHAVREP